MSLKIQLKDYDYFGNLEYLREGTERQQEAYNTLTKYNVMQSLAAYDPMPVGTIPINIDIASSDLDVICCYAEQSDFKKTIVDQFSSYPGFEIMPVKIRGNDCIVSKFNLDSFPVEIFGQSIPVKQQMGYLHMIAEAALLNEYRQSFRQKVLDLKKQGFKTEPAFALALELTGDPYIAILAIANLLP